MIQTIQLTVDEWQALTERVVVLERLLFNVAQDLKRGLLGGWTEHDLDIMKRGKIEKAA